IFGQRHVARVDFENSQAPIPVRPLDGYTAVEASWAQKRFVQPIRPVGGCNDDHSLMCIKAIHLDQQLVQRLFALIVAIDARAALAPDSIDFVDEDDTGGGFLGLIEEVSHATGPDSDQYFNKLRAAHRK